MPMPMPMPMPSPTPPPRPPCEYSHRYAPSAHASLFPTSLFSLRCDFRDLAERYPEFRDALRAISGHRGRLRILRPKRPERWEDSHSGREPGDRRREGSGGVREPTPGAASAPTFGPLSSHVTHSFNAALARSLLHHHFGLNLPSLPRGRLCPPVPNRSNYVCWLKELLARSAKDLQSFSERTTGAGLGVDGVHSPWKFRGIDIGTGVSAIYPLLLTTDLFAGGGAFAAEQRRVSADLDNVKSPSTKRASTLSSREWKFLATDIDPIAVKSACVNVRANDLENRICVVQVEDDVPGLAEDEGIRTGPLYAAMEVAKQQSTFLPSGAAEEIDATSSEPSVYPEFDFVMTNPPFYATPGEASAPRAGDKRPRTDMSVSEGVYAPTRSEAEPRGGGAVDDQDPPAVISDGGDTGFVAAIMDDSLHFRRRVTWYTSLVARRSSLDMLLRRLGTLDGVWGNHGQIRTVEFRQANFKGYGMDDGPADEEGGPRVRWGIAWTYERAAGRVAECRILSGLQSFQVRLRRSDNTVSLESADDKTEWASDEVTSRLIAYFEGLRDVALKCTCQKRRYGNYNADGKVIHRRGKTMCVTAVEERFFNSNPLNLPILDPQRDNSNLPFTGHFIIDAFVESNGRCDDGGSICVNVVLEVFSHTRLGSAIVNKVRGPLPSEIGRTSRRWRRLRKRQGAV